MCGTIFQAHTVLKTSLLQFSHSICVHFSLFVCARLRIIRNITAQRHKGETDTQIRFGFQSPQSAQITSCKYTRCSETNAACRKNNNKKNPKTNYYHKRTADTLSRVICSQMESFKKLKRGTNCPARVRSLEEFTTVCYTLNQAVTDSIHTSIKTRLIRPRWRRSITAVTKDTCAVRADVTGGGGGSVVMTAQRD